MLLHDLQNVCQATRTGQGALESVRSGRSADVIGTTSRGLFLMTEDKAIIFLTHEHYFGPMTINIPENGFNLKNVKKGEHCVFYADRIVFSGGGIQIQPNHVWLPQKPDGLLLVGKERLKQLEEIVRQTAQAKIEVGLGGCLPLLLDWSKKTITDLGLPGTEVILYPRMLELEQALGNRDWLAVAGCLVHFLGVGRGLTPAGDDFIEGCMLALNRWPEALGITEDISAFNEQVIASAQKKTTTLSANLIKSATYGQADERLIMTLDAIMTGGASAEACARAVVSIGHSSGVDALVGITVVIKAFTSI
jgi:hypothetical protein